MNKDVFITCAVMGVGDFTAHSPHVPVTPAQIARNCRDAAQAGASIVHVHVRDPATGKGARNLEYYDEVVERIRASDVDVMLNLTCGMGRMLVLDPDDPSVMAAGTDLTTPYERVEHVGRLRPSRIVRDLGANVLTPAQTREKLKLVNRYRNAA